MRLRPYQNKDFDTISQWITDAHSHAFWCANLIPYPLEKKSFDDFLKTAILPEGLTFKMLFSAIFKRLKNNLLHLFKIICNKLKNLLFRLKSKK